MQEKREEVEVSSRRDMTDHSDPIDLTRNDKSALASQSINKSGGVLTDRQARSAQLAQEATQKDIKGFEQDVLFLMGIG